MLLWLLLPVPDPQDLGTLTPVGEPLRYILFQFVRHPFSGSDTRLYCECTPPYRLVVASFSLDIDYPFLSKVVQQVFVSLVFS